MAKKRKLNTTNPKYHTVTETEQVKERKVLLASIDKGVHKKRKKIVNVYAVFKEEE